MAGVRRSEFTENLKDQNYKYFWESYDITPTKWEMIFETVQSNKAYEMFNSAIGLGELLEKPEGEDLRSDKPIESYTIVCKNSTFGRVVPFSYETVHDSLRSNIVENTVGSWGKMVPVTKEKFYAKFFIYGAYTAGYSVFNNSITDVITDSSGNKIYDGQPFFSTAHPDKVGNTYANYTASRSLTFDNLQTTYNTYTITNAKDERGTNIDLVPDTLLIPSALKFTANAILNSTLIPGNMDNDINTLKSIVNPVEWRYLTDTDGWFLGKMKAGLMATDRQDVVMDFWQDETNLDYYASIHTRFGGCVTNWRPWYACNISSS